MLTGLVPLAQAEKADRTKPMNIEADAMRYDDLKQESVFTGNVVAVRGQDVITSQSLVVNLETSAADSTGPFRGVFYPKSSNAK